MTRRSWKHQNTKDQKKALAACDRPTSFGSIAAWAVWFRCQVEVRGLNQWNEIDCFKAWHWFRLSLRVFLDEATCYDVFRCGSFACSPPWGPLSWLGRRSAPKAERFGEKISLSRNNTSMFESDEWEPYFSLQECHRGPYSEIR